MTPRAEEWAGEVQPQQFSGLSMVRGGGASPSAVIVVFLACIIAKFFRLLTAHEPTKQAFVSVESQGFKTSDTNALQSKCFSKPWTLKLTTLTPCVPLGPWPWLPSPGNQTVASLRGLHARHWRFQWRLGRQRALRSVGVRH